MMRKRRAKRQNHAIARASRRFLPRGTRGIQLATFAFLFLAFVLLALRSGEPLHLVIAVGIPVFFLLLSIVMRRYLGSDGLLMELTLFLCGLGIVMLFRFNPAKALQQTLNFLMALAGMFISIVLIRRIHNWDKWLPMIAVASLAVLVSPLVFGREINGAKAWIFLGGVSFQPSELVKVSLLLLQAHLLSRRRFVLAGVFVALCLGLLFLQKDMGTALIYYAVTLVMFFVATGSLTVLLSGAGGAMAGGLVGYMSFAHIKRRVSIWLDPWYDYAGSGYQIVQSLIAMANGGVWGVGLGVGNAYDIPEYTTDFIFPAIFNEFGALFAVGIVIVYALIVVRSFGIARSSHTQFHLLLACGCAALIGIQAFVIIGGNIKLIPLTGVTLPFLSYGGSSLLSSMILLGLVQGIAAINRRNVSRDDYIATQEAST